MTRCFHPRSKLRTAGSSARRVPTIRYASSMTVRALSLSSCSCSQAVLHELEGLAGGGRPGDDRGGVGFRRVRPVDGEAEVDPYVVEVHATGGAHGVEAGDIDAAPL